MLKPVPTCLACARYESILANPNIKRDDASADLRWVMDLKREQSYMYVRPLLSFGIAAALSAATLHAADTIAYANNPTANQFGTVDLNTGAFTKIATGVSTPG